MITDHVFRFKPSSKTSDGPRGDRPCEFMNCRRPRAEHERSISRRWGR